MTMMMTSTPIHRKLNDGPPHLVLVHAVRSSLMLMASTWIRRHLFGRRRKAQRAPLPYRRSLAVELLEDRVCPSVPIVTSIAPSAGSVAGGTQVAISGTNLAAATAVKFGSSSGSIASGSNTQIIALSPAGT